MLLVKASRADAQSNSTATLRQREESGDERGRRAKRALQLTHWGELSSARQALEGALVAPGNQETRAQLTDPSRRPAQNTPHTRVRRAQSRRPSGFGRRSVVEEPPQFPPRRRSRPSGLTGDHLRVILDSERDCVALCEFARVLVVGEVPHEVMKAIRLRRMTALSKPDGGVIVVGDFLRRLVARTLAQQFSQAVLEATSPFQFAFSTRVGTEAVTHAFQALTSSDENATNGVGVFDLISRNAMVSGLMAMENGTRCGIREFYGRPSSYLWEDDRWVTHDIHQGEGGEQSDPLMPLLFSLGLHTSLKPISDRLLIISGRHLVCRPNRVAAVYEIVRKELQRRTNIDIHCGKTKIWNRSGEKPSGVDQLTAAARVQDPLAIVWREDAEFPVSEQGMYAIRFWRRRRNTTTLCITGFSWYQTSKPVGCCCPIAPPRGPTSICAT